MGDGPVLVLGAQRSGTTLLRLLLDAHPAIAIGPETGFLRRIGEASSWGATGRRDVPWHDGWDTTAHEVEQRVARVFDDTFRAHARARGARRWGEKTPLNVAYGERIARLFPAAQVVAIVRHPVPVLRSRRAWGSSNTAPVVLANWSEVARHHVRNRALLGPDRHHLVRYEDLLADPRAVLRGVLDFLGEPWDDVVLRHHEVAEPGLTDGSNRRDRPLDPSRALAWTRGGDPAALADDLAAVAHWCRRELAWFGYAADAATPLLPLGDDPLAGVVVPDDPVPPAEPVAPDAPRAPAHAGGHATDDVGPLARARQAFGRRGAAGVARRAARDVAERGPVDAARRWARLLRGRS